MNPAPHPGKKRGEFFVWGTPTPPAEGCRPHALPLLLSLPSPSLPLAALGP